MTEGQLSEKLKLLRRKKGITLQQVADFLGINKSTVLRWENGSTEKIKGEYISGLSTLFDVPADFFFESKNDLINLKTDFFSYDSEKDGLNEEEIDKISAGVPRLIMNDGTKNTYNKASSRKDAQYFYLRINGNSMNKRGLFDGSLVLIRKQSVVENGEIAAVRVGDDEATIKVFYKIGNTVQLVPQSTDPGYHIQIYELDKTPIEVMGKAVECRFKL